MVLIEDTIRRIIRLSKSILSPVVKDMVGLAVDDAKGRRVLLVRGHGQHLLDLDYYLCGVRLLWLYLVTVGCRRLIVFNLIEF